MHTGKDVENSAAEQVIASRGQVFKVSHANLNCKGVVQISGLSTKMDRQSKTLAKRKRKSNEAADGDNTRSNDKKTKSFSKGSSNSKSGNNGKSSSSSSSSALSTSKARESSNNNKNEKVPTILKEMKSEKVKKKKVKFAHDQSKSNVDIDSGDELDDDDSEGDEELLKVENGKVIKKESGSEERPTKTKRVSPPIPPQSPDSAGSDNSDDDSSSSSSSGSDFDFGALSQEVSQKTEFDGVEARASGGESDSDSSAPKPPGSSQLSATEAAAQAMASQRRRERKQRLQDKFNRTGGDRLPSSRKDLRKRSIGRAMIYKMNPATLLPGVQRFRVRFHNQKNMANERRYVELDDFGDALEIAKAYTKYKYFGVRKDKRYKQWYQCFIILHRRIHRLSYHDTIEEAARAHDEALVRLTNQRRILNFPELRKKICQPGGSAADIFHAAFRYGLRMGPRDTVTSVYDARLPRTFKISYATYVMNHYEPGSAHQFTSQWRNSSFYANLKHDPGSKTACELAECFNLERLALQLDAQGRVPAVARVVYEMNRYAILMGRYCLERPFRLLVRLTTITLAKSGKLKQAESYARKLLPLIHSFQFGTVHLAATTLGERGVKTSIAMNIDTRQEQIWQNRPSTERIEMRKGLEGMVWTRIRVWIVTMIARLRAILERDDESLLLFDQHFQLPTFHGQIEPRLTAAALCTVQTKGKEGTTAELEILKRAQDYLKDVTPEGELADELIEALVETQLQVIRLVGVSQAQRLTQQSQQSQQSQDTQDSDEETEKTKKRKKLSKRRRKEVDIFVSVTTYAQQYPTRTAGPWGLARLYDLQLQMTDEEDEIFYAKTKSDVLGALMQTLRCDPLHFQAARALADLQDPPLPGQTWTHEDDARSEVSSFGTRTKTQADPEEIERKRQEAEEEARQSAAITELFCESIECLAYESCPPISLLFRAAFKPEPEFSGEAKALEMWKILAQCPQADLIKAAENREWWFERFFNDWQEVRFDTVWCNAVPKIDSIHYALMRQMLLAGTKMGFISSDLISDHGENEEGQHQMATSNISPMAESFSSPHHLRHDSSASPLSLRDASGSPYAPRRTLSPNSESSSVAKSPPPSSPDSVAN